jgi:ABC-type spermidine/putrescine transport system permease subunit II
MVLFINGLPIVTMALKNQWTDQNTRMHGQHQYRTQRETITTFLYLPLACTIGFSLNSAEMQCSYLFSHIFFTLKTLMRLETQSSKYKFRQCFKV